MKQRRHHGTVVADPALAAAVSAFAARHGMFAAAQRLGVSREVAAKIAGRLPVRAGSLALAGLHAAALLEAPVAGDELPTPRPVA